MWAYGVHMGACQFDEDGLLSLGWNELRTQLCCLPYNSLTWTQSEGAMLYEPAVAKFLGSLIKKDI